MFLFLSRTDKEKGRILWGGISEYGNRDDFPKSCAREKWDLVLDVLMEDRGMLDLGQSLRKTLGKVKERRLFRERE